MQTNAPKKVKKTNKMLKEIFSSYDSFYDKSMNKGQRNAQIEQLKNADAGYGLRRMTRRRKLDENHEQVVASTEVKKPARVTRSKSVSCEKTTLPKKSKKEVKPKASKKEVKAQEK